MMRSLMYVLGILILVIAGACAVAELLHMTAGSGYQPVTIGSIWHSVHANSLVGFQSFIENKISPALWGPIQYVLVEIPAWIVFAPIGLALTFAFRPRARGGLGGGGYGSGSRF